MKLWNIVDISMHVETDRVTNLFLTRILLPTLVGTYFGIDKRLGPSYLPTYGCLPKM